MERQPDYGDIDFPDVSDYDMAEGDGMPFVRVPTWYLNCNEGTVWVKWSKVTGKSAEFGLRFVANTNRVVHTATVYPPKRQIKPSRINADERKVLIAAVLRFGWHEIVD